MRDVHSDNPRQVVLSVAPGCEWLGLTFPLSLVVGTWTHNSLSSSSPSWSTHTRTHAYTHAFQHLSRMLQFLPTIVANSYIYCSCVNFKSTRGWRGSYKNGYYNATMCLIIILLVSMSTIAHTIQELIPFNLINGIIQQSCFLKNYCNFTLCRIVRYPLLIETGTRCHRYELLALYLYCFMCNFDTWRIVHTCANLEDADIRKIELWEC